MSRGNKEKEKGDEGVPMKIKKKIGRMKKLRKKMKNKSGTKNVVEEEIVILEKEIQKNHMVKETLKQQNNIKTRVPYSNLMIGLSVNALIAFTLLNIAQ